MKEELDTVKQLRQLKLATLQRKVPQPVLQVVPQPVLQVVLPLQEAQVLLAEKPSRIIRIPIEEPQLDTEGH